MAESSYPYSKLNYIDLGGGISKLMIANVPGSPRVELRRYEINDEGYITFRNGLSISLHDWQLISPQLESWQYKVDKPQIFFQSENFKVARSTLTSRIVFSLPPIRQIS